MKETIGIGLIACQQGFSASGGAEGVGKRTTSTVVISLFAIVVLDAGFTVDYEPSLFVYHESPRLVGSEAERRDAYVRGLGHGEVLRRHGYPRRAPKSKDKAAEEIWDRQSVHSARSHFSEVELLANAPRHL